MNTKFILIVGIAVIILCLGGFRYASSANNIGFPSMESDTDTIKKVVWKIIDKQGVKKHLPDSLESRYYVFHFSAKSFSVDTLLANLPRYDIYCDSIIRFLGLNKPKLKIPVYIYPNEDVKYELMGWPGRGAQSFSTGDIHMLDLDLLEHETTHVLFNSEFSWFTMPFFSEGVAMYVESSFFPDTLQRHKSVMKKYLNEPLEQWINGKVPFWEAPLYDWRPATYVAAGLFIGYVIDNFGLSKYKELHRKMRSDISPADINAVFQDVLGKSLPEIIQTWKETINRYYIEIHKHGN